MENIIKTPSPLWQQRRVRRVDEEMILGKKVSKYFKSLNKRQEIVFTPDKLLALAISNFNRKNGYHIDLSNVEDLKMFGRLANYFLGIATLDKVFDVTIKPACGLIVHGLDNIGKESAMTSFNNSYVKLNNTPTLVIDATDLHEKYVEEDNGKSYFELYNTKCLLITNIGRESSFYSYKMEIDPVIEIYNKRRTKGLTTHFTTSTFSSFDGFQDRYGERFTVDLVYSNQFIYCRGASKINLKKKWINKY